MLALVPQPYHTRRGISLLSRFVIGENGSYNLILTTLFQRIIVLFIRPGTEDNAASKYKVNCLANSQQITRPNKPF